MSDSAAVDAALVTRLATDTALLALLPDGVFVDRAPEGAEQFALVSQLAHADEGIFDGTAYEAFVYLVKAVVKSAAAATVDAAAARIKVLLDQSEDAAFAFLQPTGYQVLRQVRIERVRYREVDQQTDDTWEHAGGHYDIWAQAT